MSSIQLKFLFLTCVIFYMFVETRAILLQLINLNSVSHNETKIVSEKCENNLEEFQRAFYDREIWSLKMFDASGRISSGYAWGNNLLIGSPKSCELLNRSYRMLYTKDFKTVGYKNFTQYSAPFLVKYLVTYVRHQMKLQVQAEILIKNILTIGLCMPASCTANETEKMIENLFHHNKFIEETLYENNTEILRSKTLRLRHDYFIHPVVSLTILTTAALVLLIFVASCWILTYPKYSEKDSTLIEKLMHCFSMQENMRIILTTESDDESIEPLDGLRVVMLCWIIITNTLIYSQNSSNDLLLLMLTIENQWNFMYTCIDFSWDIVFAISGLLFSYLFIRNIELIRCMSKNNSLVIFLQMLIVRLLRLSPPYYMALLINYQLSMYLNDISQYYDYNNDELRCQEHWWKSVLYVNNIGQSVQDKCMNWGWFVAADIQCFIISLPILILFIKFRKLAAFLFALIYFSSAFITGYYAYMLPFMPTQPGIQITGEYLYSSVYARIHVYLIGVAAGYFIAKKQEIISQLSKKQIFIGWILAILSITIPILRRLSPHLSSLENSFYVPFSRTLVTGGIFFIMWACASGYGGILNRLLSIKVFKTLNRMTYSAYLLNPMIIKFISMTSEHPFSAGFPHSAVMGFGYICLAYVFAFVYMIFFQYPVLRLTKLFIQKK